MERPLIVWRYRANSVTVSRGVHWRTIWDIRIERLLAMLEQQPWADGFDIWGAGREGKRVFRSLCGNVRQRVRKFVDVDERKLARGYVSISDGGASTGPRGAETRVPVAHFSDAMPPVLICVKDMTGEVAENIRSTKLVEGPGGFVFFSF